MSHIWKDLPDDHPILQGFWVGTVVKSEKPEEPTPPEESEQPEESETRPQPTDR